MAFPPKLRERQFLTTERVVCPRRVALDVINIVRTEEGISLPSAGDSYFWKWGSDTDNPYGAGSWAKRTGKWVYDVYRRKLSSDLMGRIGNMVGEVMTASEEYWWDLTDKFDWKSGDFGDNGSCFWGCYSETKQVIIDAGGMAIRCYDGENGRGIARAWIMSVNGGWVLWNAYGKLLVEMADIVRLSLDESITRKIVLRNYGCSGDSFYINGGSGYAVGDVAFHEWIGDRYDFKLDCPEEGGYYCFACDEYIHEGDAYWFEGGTYCEYCYDNNFFYCEHCNEDRERDIEIYFDHNSYCEFCVEEYLTRCDECGEYTYNEDVVEFKSVFYCDYCADKVSFECYECGERHELDKKVDKDGKAYCETCGREE